MRKIFKIVLVIFVVIIIIVSSLAAILFLDLAAYTATGSQTLTPTGISVGKALVVYDPGLSGTAKGRMRRTPIRCGKAWPNWAGWVRRFRRNTAAPDSVAWSWPPLPRS